MPSTSVWKWNMRLRPTRSEELPMPLRSSRRGVSNAPPASTTCPALTSCSRCAGVEVADAAGACGRCGRARHPSRSDSGGSRTARCASARRSGATGSPLASIGQPKNPQNPQLLHAGRPSYPTLFAPVGARYGCSPRRGRGPPRARRSTCPAPAASGYGPDRHAANGLAVCVAGHADEALGLGVVRLELVVVERPVDDVGVVDRAQLGAQRGSRSPGSAAASRRRGSPRRPPSTAGCSRRR